MNRVPIVRLFRSIGFNIKFFCIMLFYNFPLWMVGNRWCDGCSVRIKPHEYLKEHMHYGYDGGYPAFYCKKCEEDCT